MPLGRRGPSAIARLQPDDRVGLLRTHDADRHPTLRLVPQSLDLVMPGVNNHVTYLDDSLCSFYGLRLVP